MDNIEIEPIDRSEIAPPQSIQIEANLADTFTFASHQNSIPVIRSIRIKNATTEPIQGVRLELTASPAPLADGRQPTRRLQRPHDQHLLLSDRRPLPYETRLQRRTPVPGAISASAKILRRLHRLSRS